MESSFRLLLQKNVLNAQGGHPKEPPHEHHDLVGKDLPPPEREKTAGKLPPIQHDTITRPCSRIAALDPPQIKAGGPHGSRTNAYWRYSTTYGGTSESFQNSCVQESPAVWRSDSGGDRYDVRMRASQENDLHEQETRRLLGVLEQKNRELSELMAHEPSEDMSIKNLDQVNGSEGVLTARAAVVAAKRQLDAHVTAPKHLVRNYRILESESGEELDHFTDDYEIAPWTAAQRMRMRSINHYVLQEQQPDGTWVTY